MKKILRLIFLRSEYATLASSVCGAVQKRHCLHCRYQFVSVPDRTAVRKACRHQDKDSLFLVFRAWDLLCGTLSVSGWPDFVEEKSKRELCASPENKLPLRRVRMGRRTQMECIVASLLVFCLTWELEGAAAAVREGKNNTTSSLRSVNQKVPLPNHRSPHLTEFSNLPGGGPAPSFGASSRQ